MSIDSPLQVTLSRALVTDKGRPGGEFLIARSIIEVLDVPAPTKRRTSAGTAASERDTPARTLTPHMRSGHYRRQRYGKGAQLVKIVWIPACEVGGPLARKAASPARRPASPSPRRSRVAPRAAAPAGWTSAA